MSVPCVDHNPTHLLVKAVHLPGSHLSQVAHAQVEEAGIADGGARHRTGTFHRISVGVHGCQLAVSDSTVTESPDPGCFHSSNLVILLTLH